MAFQIEGALARQASFVCRSCQKALARSQRQEYVKQVKGFAPRRHEINPSRTFRANQIFNRSSSSSTLKTAFGSRYDNTVKEAPPLPATTKAVPANDLKTLNKNAASIIAAKTAANEDEVLELVKRFENFANSLANGDSRSQEEIEKQRIHDTASSTLSDLEEGNGITKSSRAASESSESFRENAVASLCETLYKLVSDPKVFISPSILEIYVRTQCVLGRPEYLPEIFYLYANKSIAQPNTNPIRYNKQSPNSPKNAIPLHLSDMALNAAIASKDLPLAITIIDQTVAKPAFRRNKFLRKASLPLAAVGATPFCAYAGAHWVSQWQNVWDPEMATTTAMAGSLAYIGTLSIIGYVAVTTFNDHHDRVVWVIGTPLRYRWTREEERLYFDRVAQAWGFQQKWKRGEEQGEEWEALREVIGMRDMALDKPELMEGME